MPHPLDRPVWNSLQSYHAEKSQGDALACAMLPQFGPFAALFDNSEENFAALEKLQIGDDGFWLVEREEIEPKGNFKVANRAKCTQMVNQNWVDIKNDAQIVPLTDEDAVQIYDLAMLCKPGPFARQTYQLGQFIGVKENGKLIAMGGERMRMDGFAELTALCTHPDYRGKGIGAKIMSIITRRIIDRGQTAFLHSYAENFPAIKLYESLGFKTREFVQVTVLQR